jgi:hypothetical protein
MVVDDFDIFGARLCPTEANSPLIVDPDRVLANAIALERFEPVTGRSAKVVKFMSVRYRAQAPLRPGNKVGRETFRSLSGCNLRDGLALEGNDHEAKPMVCIIA